MKSCLDCIPCFFKQTLQAARLAGADETLQRQILNDVAAEIPGFPLDASPPVMGRTLHRIIRQRTGHADPYREIKDESNRRALACYDELTAKVTGSDYPLLTAVELSIAGNIIDFGVNHDLDIHREIEAILSCLDADILNRASGFFDFKALEDALKANETGTLLFLADNAGELLFDRILLEEIHRRHPDMKLICAVKESPIINDALREDALACGIHGLAEIVSSGSDAPGTVPDVCSRPFLKTFYRADLVISKGQGNFEALSGIDRSVFFLFLAKCPVIARHAGCALKEAVLFHHI